MVCKAAVIFSCSFSLVSYYHLRKLGLDARRYLRYHLKKKGLMRKSTHDPTYLDSFQIKTPIVYLSDVVIADECKKNFSKDWGKFQKRHSDDLSKTRKAALKRFMRRIATESSDAFTRNWVSIRYIGKTMGYGVFAKCAIPPYKTITHYAGLLTFDADIKQQNDSTFVITDFPKYAINGASHGNWSRFMNHADEDDDAKNVIPWELYLPEGPRIVFTAGSRGIKKGEQLLYSYGDSYWD